MDPNELKNRCVGAIAGFAIGDALGMPAAFLSRDQIRRYYGKPISGFLKAHPGHASDFLPRGLLHRQYPDDACNRGMPDRMQKDGSGAAGGCIAFVVFKHRPASDSLHRKSASLQASVHRTAVEQKRRFQQRLRCRHAHDSDRALLQPLPRRRLRAQLWTTALITHNEPRARAAAVSVAYLTARLLQSDERSWPADQVLETADHIAHLDEDLAAVLRWSTQITHLPPEEALFEIGTSSDASKRYRQPFTAF